jgi:hypothetical protein
MIAPGSAFTNNFGAREDASQPLYAETISTTSSDSPATGIWRGQVSVGRRASPRSRYGRRYWAISSVVSSRSVALGRTDSTNMFFSRIMSSPAGDRNA